MDAHASDSNLPRNYDFPSFRYVFKCQRCSNEQKQIYAMVTISVTFDSKIRHWHTQHPCCYLFWPFSPRASSWKKAGEKSVWKKEHCHYHLYHQAAKICIFEKSCKSLKDQGSSEKGGGGMPKSVK